MTASAVGPLLTSVLPPDRFHPETETAQPQSTEELAQLLRTTTAEKWRTTIRGNGTWHIPPRGDFTICTLGLTSGFDLQAADLVVTVGAGTTMSTLRRELAAENVWLSCDPPGAERTIGSVISTGTSGPLSFGFGAIRDQVLGLTVVTGGGRILKLGGKVVKNVAGFDLIRLMTGAYGTYGVITQANLRVRALPASDRTFHCTASLDDAAKFLEATNISRLNPSACSIRADSSEEAEILVRSMGSDPHVRLLAKKINDISDLKFAEVDSSETRELWQQTGDQNAPSSVRCAFKPSQLTEAISLIQRHEPGGALEISPTRLRWCGELFDSFSLFRTEATAAGMSVALERAPEDVVSGLGHYPRASEPQRAILDRLQKTFDPGGVLVQSLEGTS